MKSAGERGGCFTKSAHVQMLSGRCDQMTQTAIQIQGPCCERVSLLGTPVSMFAEAVKSVDDRVVRQVCSALGLTLDELIQRVPEMNYSEYQRVLVMLSPLSDDGSREPPTSAEITELAARVSLNFKYACNSSKPSVLFGPIVIGHEDVNIETRVTLPVLGARERILVQCVSRHDCAFPPSLSLSVNDFIMIDETMCLHTLPFIDISRIAPSSSTVKLKLRCAREREDYVFVMRLVEKLTDEEILNEIMQKSGIVFECGTSDKDLLLPARASMCAHTQCFDLRNVLKRAKMEHELICPICERRLQISDIMIDFELLQQKVAARVDNLIKEMKAAGIAINEVNFDRRPDPRTFVDVGTQPDLASDFEFTDVGTMTFDF